MLGDFYEEPFFEEPFFAVRIKMNSTSIIENLYNKHIRHKDK